MEYLDICTEDGIPTGETVSREEAHTRGICHRTAHVWLVRRAAGPSGKTEILLQRRSRTKDSFPGCLDTSSAGHIPAGVEPPASAVRELHEELGLDITTDALSYIGKIRIHTDMVFHGKPFRDNEVIFVYLCEKAFCLEEITIQEEELEDAGWYDLEETIARRHSGDPDYCVPESSLQLLKDYLTAHPISGF